MSRRRLVALVPVLAALACDSAPPAAGAPPAADAPQAGATDLPQAPPDVLYAIGSVLADQVKEYQLDETEARELARGVTDAVLRKARPEIRSEEMGAKVSAFHEARLKALAQREELAGAFLLEAAGREPGVVKTEGGGLLKVIEAGSGPKPRLYDLVAVNHQGKLRDGTVFNSNEGRPPEKSQLGVNTRCWQQALGAVGAGARLHVVCPPALSYGWGGWPGVVPGGAVLSYELELVSVEPQPQPPGWTEGD